MPSTNTSSRMRTGKARRAVRGRALHVAQALRWAKRKLKGASSSPVPVPQTRPEENMPDQGIWVCRNDINFHICTRRELMTDFHEPSEKLHEKWRKAFVCHVRKRHLGRRLIRRPHPHRRAKLRGVGTVKLYVNRDGRCHELELTNVLYIPSLFKGKQHLISLDKLKINDTKLHDTPTVFQRRYYKAGDFVCAATRNEKGEMQTELCIEHRHAIQLDTVRD